MKSALVLALALMMAAPATVAVYPTAADAQVLAGGNAARRRPPRQVGLSERDRERLYEAQDEIIEHETAIGELTAITENGGALTPVQIRQLEGHQRRLQSAQQTVERLEAKRERLEN